MTAIHENRTEVSRIREAFTVVYEIQILSEQKPEEVFRMKCFIIRTLFTVFSLALCYFLILEKITIYNVLTCVSDRTVKIYRVKVTQWFQAMKLPDKSMS